jgi:WD40 repeat protein
MDSLQGLFNGLAGLAVVLGLVYCFAGYRIRRFILAVPGYIAGAAVLGALGYLLSQEMWVAVLAGVFAGGPIGASIVLALYNVKVFSIGLLLGAVIDVALYLLTDGQIEPAVLLIIPIVTGILALIYDKWVIVAGTAFGGAGLAVGGIAYFAFGGVGPAALFALLEGDPSLLAATLGGWLVLGVVGVIVQYQSLKARDDGDWWGGPDGDSEQGSSRSMTPESNNQGRSSGQPRLSASPQIRRQALTGHSEVSAIIWDPHGRWFATAGKYGEVYLWDPQTGRPILQLWGSHTNNPPRSEPSLAVAQDGSWIAANGGADNLWFWDTATGRLLSGPDTEPADDLCPLAIDSSGDLWDRTTWVRIRRREDWASSGSATDPNRRWIASRANKGRIYIRDMRNERRLKQLASGRDIESFEELIASGDGRWLISREAYDLDFWLVDGQRSAPSPRFEGTSAVGYEFAGTRVGQRRFAVTSKKWDGNGYVLEMWELSDYPELLWEEKFPDPRGKYPIPVTAAPNGHWFACLTGSIEVFDAASGQLLRSFPSHNEKIGATACAASPDGRALAAGFGDGSVALFDVETDITRHRMRSHQRCLNALAIPADGRLAAAGTSGIVHFWDPTTGRQTTTLKGYPRNHYEGGDEGGVGGMAASIGGAWLAAVGKGRGPIVLWDTQSRHQQRIEFPGGTGRNATLASAPDGRSLILANENRYVYLFDSQSGDLISTHDPDFMRTGICCLFHRPMGRPLATGFLYENLCIWRSFHELMTGRASDEDWLESWSRSLGCAARVPLQILREWGLLPAKAPLSGIAPSRNATWLAAPGGSDGILVRNPRTGKELHRLHGHEGSVNSLAVHPNGRWLFSAGDDGIIRRWDMSRLPNKPVCDLAMEALPDDDWVVWKVNPDEPNDRYWTDYSPGAKRWLGWHAPVPGTDRWAHQPMDAFPDPR